MLNIDQLFSSMGLLVLLAISWVPTADQINSIVPIVKSSRPSSIIAWTRLLHERYSVIPDSSTSTQDCYTTSTRLTTRSLLEHTDLNRGPTRSVHEHRDNYSILTRTIPDKQDHYSIATRSLLNLYSIAAQLFWHWNLDLHTSVLWFVQRRRYKEGLNLEEITMKMEQLILYTRYLELQRNRVIAIIVPSDGLISSRFFEETYWSSFRVCKVGKRSGPLE